MTDGTLASLQKSADALGCDILVVPPCAEPAFGSFLRSALGGGHRREGPPYEHRHALPETEEAMRTAPVGSAFTVDRPVHGA